MEKLDRLIAIINIKSQVNPSNNPRRELFRIKVEREKISKNKALVRESKLKIEN